MADIPQSVRDNNPAFWHGVFNSDKSKRQLDGFKINPQTEQELQPRQLVHPNAVLLHWCRYEADPQAIVDTILQNATTLTPSDYRALRNNPQSEWYINTTGDIE
ncbi:hypothetical protein [Catenovulum sediminis]|uniref:Uncharacterized protein n=1 Tax=Catenovulum sediminis TaxID=1740262 RepID=A0ABV1RP04_9ALTE